MFGLGMKKKKLTVNGMTCHHCEMTIEKALLGVEGIKAAKADHNSNSVEIEFRNEVDLTKIKESVEKAGYKFVGEN